MTIQAELLDGRVEDEELAPQVQVGGPLVGTRHSSGGQALQSASQDLRPPRRPSTRHRDLLDHPRVLRAPGLTPRRRRLANDHWEDSPRFTPVDPMGRVLVVVAEHMTTLAATSSSCVTLMLLHVPVVSVCLRRPRYCCRHTISSIKIKPSKPIKIKSRENYLRVFQVNQLCRLLES